MLEELNGHVDKRRKLIEMGIISDPDDCGFLDAILSV